MSYIDYLNNFNRWIEADSPTDKAIILYYGLLDTFNCRRWPGWAGVDTQRLMMLARTSDKKTALRARDALVRAGFIEYKRGKRGKATEYRLLKYGGKSLPVNATENATISPTESATPNIEKDKEINIDFSGDGGEAPASAPETNEAVTDFIIEHGDALDAFLGMTDEVKAQVWKIAEDLFHTYANRQPTEADAAKVFSYTRADGDAEDGVAITFSEDRVGLLSYAFQQSNHAGRPGNWSYIEAIMGRAYQRGIKNADDAEVYDDERTLQMVAHTRSRLP